jgi:hypothetical protein
LLSSATGQRQPQSLESRLVFRADDPRRTICETMAQVMLTSPLA